MKNTLKHCAYIFMFSLLVSACSSGEDEQTVEEETTVTTEEPANEAPVSSAGPDLVVDEGTMVQLDGSSSSDPEMDTLSYQWTQTSGQSVALMNDATATATFLAPSGRSVDLTLTFSLTVNDGELDSAPDVASITVKVAPPTVANGLRTTITSAMSKGRFTFNNPWTVSELSYEGIPTTMDYQTIANARPEVHPYTITVVEYEERKRQCEEDYNSFHPFLDNYDPPLPPAREYTIRDRKCYPKHEWVYYNDPSAVGDAVASQALFRYGYYCGGGYGGGVASSGYEPPIFDSVKPEPLDGLDYCCRLHDNQTWRGYGDQSNECGIAMCLNKVSVFGISDLPADVQEAREHWYGDSVAGGASFACPGDQTNAPYPPVPE